ncbi:SGNH/GDSL hydrolase family protein [Herbiconiux ginsengi]|uniref:Acetyl esterase/acyl-CoA thioesterase-1 n=1 Tax=Herbiconiux ginsengi TaxID=381665 RepID=A0A1H3KZL8_9MICO|nr:GDSL-type esterase/lipase family protein [Herbiconiux ginsengi]SDY57148.1 acetyl esterase/acyl-CoA thioesterase-1 [Herbiconiux ginsengi]
MTAPETATDADAVDATDPVADELRDPHKFTARFLHPDKYPVLQRTGLLPADLVGLEAAMAGTDEAALHGYRAEFAREVHSAVSGLSPDAASRLPFRPGEVVVALGDSITDDSLSWAHQLQAYLDRHRPDDGIRVVNAGITGHTTQEAIARIDRLIALGPDWVIQLLGTNDARRHGAARVQMQSIGETRRNLALLAELVAAETGATLVSMTPPPVIEADADAWVPFHSERITWRETDVAAIAEAVRQQATILVDVHRVFLDHATTTRAALLLPDGVHPTVAGQRLILEVLLDTLTKPAQLDGELRLEGEDNHDDRESPATT